VTQISSSCEKEKALVTISSAAMFHLAYPQKKVMAAGCLLYVRIYYQLNILTIDNSYSPSKQLKKVSRHPPRVHNVPCLDMGLASVEESMKTE